MQLNSIFDAKLVNPHKRPRQLAVNGLTSMNRYPLLNRHLRYILRG
jgi:hypothetical protein